MAYGPHISIMCSVVFVLNKSLNSRAHHMQQKFNVELINKIAHSVCLLVKASVGTLLRTRNPTSVREDRADRTLLHTLRHSSY